ncbi:unnamed protein product [Cercopithifilaria johnstoni]|uniref:Uncharacterized protein n=1 Tax=Cercopithifilaria johnstoni TaxID=2874296 RepID=A0A8J2MED0_9BILA|nr:unnamed protein product [Cercopithifilaria johnstoni]
MCFMLMLLAPFFIIIIQSSSGKFGQYCISDGQCGPGKRCVPNIAGLSLCQQVLEQISNRPVPKQIFCTDDEQCRPFGGKCIRLGWYGSCQYGSLEWKISGLINDRCYNDADCSQYLHCVNRNGMMTCQAISGMLQYKTCQSDADCGILQICSFSKQYDTNLCVTSPEYRTTKMSSNIGSSVIPSSLIGNGALSKDFEKQCTADYQCSVFEICAKKSISSDRICIYNPMASNRQCRFNADCQSGQRCEKVLENLYLCRAAKQTTFMQLCNYDYECSGDQRCTIIGNNASFQQNFRYCNMFDEERSCENDLDCTDRKVCRIFGKIKQCIPFISSSHFTP